MKSGVEKVVPVSHPQVQKKIDRSLKASVVEGSFASVGSGLGPSYFSPLAIAMNASSSQVGILHAIMSLVPSVSQLCSARLIQKFKRKAIVVWSVLFEILMFIPIILSGYLYYLGFPHVVWMLILFIGIHHAFAGMGGPAWFSWMGSLVPENRRGRYFSRRTRTASFFSILTMIGSAIFLDYFKGVGEANGNLIGYTMVGFGILLSLSMAARFISWSLLSSQYEPRIRVRKKDYFSFWQLMKGGSKTPFGRFIWFRFLFSLVVGISAPFWAVYMLRSLGLSYIWFMAISISGTLFQILFLPIHGKLSDKFGNVQIIKISVWTSFVAPIMWYLSSFIPNKSIVPIYLFFVPAIVGGFFWAGYNLASSNYIYDSVSSRKQSFGLSYVNLMSGIGSFIGSMIGSAITFYGIGFMDTLLFIFIISSVGRLLIAFMGSRLLKETRHVRKLKTKYILREIMPRGFVPHFLHLPSVSAHHQAGEVQNVEHYIVQKKKRR